MKKLYNIHKTRDACETLMPHSLEDLEEHERK